MLQQEFTKDGLPSMRPYLKYLLDRGYADQVKVKWGKGYRNVIIIGGKKYLYKGGDEFNKNLKKKIVSLYINMSDKTLDQKTKKSDNSVGVNLKFDDDGDRTWINKDRFDEFESEYQQSQDDSSLSDTSRVEFEIHIKMVKVETKTEETNKIWINMTTVYGGVNGVKLFIKHKIIEMVYAYEDSDWEIISMSIIKLYIKKQKQTQNTNFRDIKMFGAVFNYNGFALEAIKSEVPNSCVPEYLLKLYNNPEETNPRKRLAKLTMDKLLQELNMKAIDEGCSIAQIAVFCEIHKITYYALDFKYKLFETNNHLGYNSNLPRLVFVCATNHLFPVTDTEKRETIFKTCSAIGGKLNKYKSQQKFENVKLGYNETLKNYVLLPDMSFYALFAKVESDKHHDAHYSTFRIIITTPGLCNTLFYEEIRRGNIHNGKVRLSKGNQIVGFEMLGITIDENEHYNDIQITIDTLNEDIDKDSERYNYTGQNHHSLAYAYYTNNYDLNIVSNCSPQVYDILTSGSCMNSPFFEFYKNQGTTAYDKNKQYTHILMNSDIYGWSIFKPTDEVKPFDGTIETGMYFAVTSNYFPLKGNGWYFDDTVDKALKYNLITKNDIKYQVKASCSLDQYHFKQFVRDVYDKFEPTHGNGGKLAINGFIGMLGKSKAKSTRHYFESNYDVVANELINSTDNIEIKGIYPPNQTDAEHVNLLNLSDDELECVINKTADNTSEPILYQLSTNTEIPTYENTLPIHRKIYDKANMEMYELYLEVKDFNPDCELVGIKTDCLVFNNITHDPPTSDRWGDIKKCDVPSIKECTVNQEKKLRTDLYEPNNTTWNSITWSPETGYKNHKGIMIDSGLESYVEQGYLTIGMAGTGKSEILQEAQVLLSKNEAVRQFITACPTHKACKIVNGVTIHRLFGVNPMDHSYEYKKVVELKSVGIKYIFIDEVSMVSEQMWNVIAHIKQQFEFVFVGFGDFKQLKPVGEEHIDFKHSWIVKYVFNNTICELTHIHRFDGSKLLQDAHKCANGESIDFNDYTKEEHSLSLCWTNQAVDAINQKWNKHYANGKQVEVNGFKQSKYILHVGLKLMAYKSNGKKYYNSEDFTVKSFDDKYMCLLNDFDNSEINIELKFTNHFKPMYAMTVHKAQGMTINRPYSIYEYNRMQHDMLYVALTRTSKKEYVNFCEISLLKPYVGYIYRYSYNGKSYIGSTTDVKRRKEDHKTNTTNKFGRAIQRYGYKQFDFEILEKLQYSDKSELYDLENQYIIKYDSINNGYNCRRNEKADN